MSKIKGGISNKMTAYIKKSGDNGGVHLYTAANEEAPGGAYVYMVNGYMACRVGLAYYKDELQPFTCMDAPEIGQTKTVTGNARDGASFVKIVEDALAAPAEAFFTGFTRECGSQKKQGRIFTSVNGQPIMVDAALLDLFNSPHHYTMRTSIAPIALHKCGDFGAVDAIVLPLRIGDDLKVVMDVIAQTKLAQIG